ncbi:MAG: PEPxxWA-CTERM sorting domain-containing protein [Phenylobacterium sp.]|nr:PEPxxWA-CTERM sorting domain-containing protein [Phenylobacterium sp.]
MAGTLVATSASAIELRAAMGGDAGYGEGLARNDDGSAGPLPMPFSINFFGQTYDHFYLNNNGNITFTSSLGSYTPVSFPVTNQPMIAPFWADVDTRCDTCGLAYSGSAGPNQFSVTWHDVGYYSQHSDLTNDFQLTIFDRSDTGEGNFDIEFRYNRLQWTTGDVSGGVPAQAGYDAGDGENYFKLPGSFTEDVVKLADTSNVSGETPGLWFFNIRNGALADGATPETALVPTVVTDSGGYQFDFMVAENQRIFIDPLVAIGYDYELLSGPNILSALFPILSGQSDPYLLYALNGDFLGSVFGGNVFNFGAGGVSGFRLRGIDPDIALDPNYSQAFVTGLTFAVANGPTQISILQTPVTFDTGGVPEPATWTMLILGFGAVGAALRSRRRTAAAWA